MLPQLSAPHPSYRRRTPLLLATVLLALVVAWGVRPVPATAQAGGAPSPIGAWLGIFPDAEPGEVAQRVLVNIHADGTLAVFSTPAFLLTEMGSLAARIHLTPGAGSWAPDGDRRYRATFVFLMFDDVGAYFGMQEIQSVLTLAADGNSATTTDSGRITLADGTVVESWQDEPGPSLTRIRP